jgi:hypothetical protein
MFYPEEVGYTLVAPPLAGSFGGFIDCVRTLASEPVSLVILGLGLSIVAIGIRRRESLPERAARAKVIPLETAKIERRLATPAPVGLSPVSSVSPKPRYEFSVNRQRRKRMMECEILFSRGFRPFQ